jgi:hypothetical protein
MLRRTAELVLLVLNISLVAAWPAAARSPSPSATTGPAFDALEALDCDGAPSSAGSDLSPGDIGGGSEDPVESAIGSLTDFVAPRAGYELAALFEHQALVVYRNDGRVKVAVVLRDDLRPFFPAWDVTALRMCDLAEWGADVDLGPDRQVWAHPDGSIRSSRMGSGHCGWQSVRALRLHREGQDEYVRDPMQSLGDVLSVAYAEGFALPADALDTGFRWDGHELWEAPDGHAAFVVRPDGVVERWPRMSGGAVCGG